MDIDLAPHTTEPRVRGARNAPSWPAFAAWGAGLIQIALGAGAITGEGATVATRAVGFLLVTLGIGALAWGLATLARGRIVAPRASVVGALVGLLTGAIALAVDPARTSVFAVAVASVLLVFVAMTGARRLRRREKSIPDAAATSTVPNSNVVGIVVGALLIAALVTPALAATEAGMLAPDHGDHGMIMESGHH